MWKILLEIGIPDHLTCLVQNLHVGQEATELDMEQQTVPNWERSMSRLYIVTLLFNLHAECTVLIAPQLCPSLCNPTDYTPPGSSVHGVLQARILEWVAISFSRGSMRPRSWTQLSSTAGRFYNIWATREFPRVTV